MEPNFKTKNYVDTTPVTTNVRKALSDLRDDLRESTYVLDSVGFHLGKLETLGAPKNESISDDLTIIELLNQLQEIAVQLHVLACEIDAKI